VSGVAGAPRGGRFPGFDVASQAGHWDPVTAGVVLGRLGMPPDLRFFSPDEEAIATALCDQLLGQRDAPKVPIVNLIDARLAGQETDGWHYADMPEDGVAWRLSLAALDADAIARHSAGFAGCAPEDQVKLIQAVQDPPATGMASMPGTSGACGPATRVLRFMPRLRRGTRSASPARPTRAGIRTPAWTRESPSRSATPAPRTTRSVRTVTGEPAERRPGAKFLGVAAAQ
jgi:hypothetical protein